MPKRSRARNSAGASHVPDGEGEHAVQVFDAVLAPFGIGLEDDLGVALGKEVIAPGAQLGAQFRVVVDGAVEHQRQVQFGHRPSAGWNAIGQIDDGQPPVAEGQRTVRVAALVVRTAPLQL
jgi:hypothetical protein